MSGTCGARTTPIPSQRARVSSVGKTPSFSFCQVDMYVIGLFLYRELEMEADWVYAICGVYIFVLKICMFNHITLCKINACMCSIFRNVSACQ